MSGRHYPIAGKRLWVEDDGDGEPIILIHGLTLDSRMWEPQLPALLTSQFRIIRPDLCGFGVKSLVIMDTALRLKDREVLEHDDVKQETIDLMKLDKWAEARNRWRTSEIWSLLPNGDLHPLLKSMLDDCFAKPHRWYLADRNDGFTADDFPSIAVPTSVMCGEREIEEIGNDTVFLRDHIKNSQMRLVPGAGHMPNIDNPGFVNNHLVSFLRRASL